MQTINATAAEAEDALVALARHVPREVDLGRPLIARTEDDGAVLVVTTAAWWWLEPGGTAARLLPLGDDRAELCRWRDGVELHREIDAVGVHGSSD